MKNYDNLILIKIFHLRKLEFVRLDFLNRYYVKYQPKLYVEYFNICMYKKPVVFKEIVLLNILISLLYNIDR